MTAMGFTEALALAVDYLEAGYDCDAEASRAIRARLAESGAAEQVLAVVAGLFWIVAEQVTGDNSSPDALKRLVREASVEMELRSIDLDGT